MNNLYAPNAINMRKLWSYIGFVDKKLKGLDDAGGGFSNVDNTSDADKPVSTSQQTALDLKANIASPTFTGTVSGITKAHVGLSNVDNTSDAAKPVSTAQATALNLKADISAVPTIVSAMAGNLTSLSSPSAVSTLWKGTQVQYDAIVTKADSTLYFII